MKPKFIWSNEDAFFILGALLTMMQIGFDYNNPVFALAVGMALKGLMSMFSLTLGNDASEDVMLIIGAFVTLAGIHFDYKNPVFCLTIAAIIKAGFGIFGVSIPLIPIAQPATTVTAVTPTIKAPMFFLALLGAMLLYSGASAGWVIPAESFHVSNNASVYRLGSPTGTIDGDIIPTINLGIGTTGPTPSYGASIGYDFVIGTVSTIDENHISDSPIFGIGGSFYGDFAPFLGSNFSNPPILSGGFNIVGPELNVIGGVSLVPCFQKTWVFQGGATETVFNLTAPFSIADSVIIPIFGK